MFLIESEIFVIYIYNNIELWNGFHPKQKKKQKLWNGLEGLEVQHKPMYPQNTSNIISKSKPIKIIFRLDRSVR